MARLSVTVRIMKARTYPQVTTPAAHILASWAAELQPSDDDLALAERSLRDTLAVMYAARDHPLRPLFGQLGEAGRWAAEAHVLDFDDLHMASTTHISAVCVPVALATHGGARAYLAGAGVMARLGTALGWRHYTAGWHATCTAGGPAAAVTAAIAHGLDAEQTANAIALAVPAAGGVQRAFGTAAKALQVGFAADAGVRAAALARDGASADPTALDEWLRLVGAVALPHGDGTPDAVPGGLAIKLYPCCYALQRPISAVVELGAPPVDGITKVTVTTPESSLKPLIHQRPATGLEGKFSLEYGIAATLLDGRPTIESFSDLAVQRPEAQRLVDLVEVEPVAGGRGLLDGDVRVEIELSDGEKLRSSLSLPPGAPGRPPTDDELRQKLQACGAEAEGDRINSATWETARPLATR
jgi:2-methylcitrate dehydratase PrpD